MTEDPRKDPDRSDSAVRDALSGFNAEEIVDDPDELDRPDESVPAATPDSPNPI